MSNRSNEIHKKHAYYRLFFDFSAKQFDSIRDKLKNGKNKERIFR